MSAQPRLQDRTAVITGANQGIGAATARRFAAEGCALHLWDLREDGMAKVAEDARAAGVKVSTRAVDVTDPEAVEVAMSAAHRVLGRIDILVNCAGVFLSAPLLETSLADFERIMKVNVTGTLLCMQAALRRMQTRGYGKIVNLASIAGRRGDRLVSAYVASKHAVVGLTRSAAMEFARSGITVNAICPGYVETDMFNQVLGTMGSMSGIDDPEAMRKAMLKGSPIRRMTRPAEIAGVALFLASPESDGMTAQTIVYDGGMVQA